MDNKQQPGLQTQGEGGPPAVITLPRKDAARVFSRIGLGMVLFLIVQYVLVSVIYVVVTYKAPWMMTTGWFSWAVSYVPLYLVGFPVFFAVIKNMNQYDIGPAQPKRMNVLSFLGVYAVCVAAFYTFNLITVFINQAIQQGGGSGIAGPADTMLQSNAWVNFFVVCVVAPVMEEIIFRQLMYKRLVGFGGKVFILFSSLMFALMHPNLYQIVYAFLIGLLLAGVRYFTGKLWLCILLHMVVNLSGGGGSMLLLAYFGIGALEVWNIVLVCLTVLGIIIAAWWLIKKRRSFVPNKGLYASPGASAMIFNVGVLLCIAYDLFMIISSLLVGA